jgi:hypothetical protein
VSQVLQIKHKGLYTAPNEFSAVPQGALLLASNCVIDDNNILESRRGNDRNFQLPAGGDRASRYEFYQSKQIIAYTSGKLGYKPAGSFVPYSGTYSDPSSTLARRRFLKANNNLYFTTSAGIYKLDAYNGTPVQAGMYKGLDLAGVLAGGGTGFLSNNNQVAYRVVWGIKDANNNIPIGAPSGREIVINGSGSSSDVTLTLTIPSGITVSHFFQVYRSKQSGGVAVVPNDELQLVYENNPTAGEITAKAITFTDSTPDSLRGAALYTNPSEQGSKQGNDPPPMSWDMTLFQGSTVYANIQSKNRLTFTILACAGTGGIHYGDTIVIAGTTYTARGTETVASLQYSLHGSFSTTGDTTLASDTLTNVVSTIGCEIGRAITGTNIPGGTTIVSFTATTIKMSANATGSTAGVTITVTNGGTPAQDIADTAVSLIRVINRNSTNTSVYAYYLSGENDLPGAILIEERGLGGSAFSITASAHGTAFNPVLPTSGTSVISSNDDLQHALMVSKTDQSEAVPLVNIFRVGAANNAILRVFPLRNSLFIFKENEGIYRMTGTSPTSFQIEQFDNSANLIAPDSVALVNNQVWALSDQGVIVVSETGVSVVSRPIEDLVLDQFGGALTAAKYYSFGIGYETDRKYILFTVSSSADTVPSQAFVFNVFTEGFTRWPLTMSTGIVNKEDDHLYLSDGLSNYQLKERKTRDFTDFVDEGIAYTLSSFTGTQMVLTSTNEVQVGDLLWQSSTVYSVITAVDPAFVTVADTLDTWTAGAVTVFKGINCDIEYAAVTGENPGLMKQFPEIAFLFRTASFRAATASFATDLSPSFEDVPLAGEQEGTWGLSPWGDAPWGGSNNAFPIRTYIPLEKQRAALLRVRFNHRQGYGNFQLNGFSVPVIDNESFKVTR